jgi:hypothetical protein
MVPFSFTLAYKIFKISILNKKQKNSRKYTISEILNLLIKSLE